MKYEVLTWPIQGGLYLNDYEIKRIIEEYSEAGWCLNHFSCIPVYETAEEHDYDCIFIFEM